jgi:phage terminase large subunit-like protein
VYLPIKKIGNKLSKEAKVRFLSPLIENGVIRFPESGAEDMIDEITNFPKWKFDDQCDGLYLAVQVIPSGGGVSVVASARSSAVTAAQKIIGMVRRW